MKRLIITVLVVSVLLIGCATVDETTENAGLTIDLVDDDNHVLDIPQEFEQEEYMPAEGTNFYERQAILSSELGARLYNRGRRAQAYDKLVGALSYDPDNNKAHFSLGLMLYEDNEIALALHHFQQVRRQEARRFPYDIDYFTAAQMILDYFPFQAKVTSFPQRREAQGSAADGTRTVIINKGRNQGVLEGMEFVMYRVGNAIRDVNTLDVIGENRIPYATAEVTEVRDNNAVCSVEKYPDAEVNVQIDDLLETEYLEKAQDVRTEVQTDETAARGSDDGDIAIRDFDTEEAER